MRKHISATFFHLNIYTFVKVVRFPAKPCAFERTKTVDCYSKFSLANFTIHYISHFRSNIIRILPTLPTNLMRFAYLKSVFQYTFYTITQLFKVHHFHWLFYIGNLYQYTFSPVLSTTEICTDRLRCLAKSAGKKAGKRVARGTWSFSYRLLRAREQPLEHLCAPPLGAFTVVCLAPECHKSRVKVQQLTLF